VDLVVVARKKLATGNNLFLIYRYFKYFKVHLSTECSLTCLNECSNTILSSAANLSTRSALYSLTFHRKKALLFLVFTLFSSHTPTATSQFQRVPHHPVNIVSTTAPTTVTAPQKPIMSEQTIHRVAQPPVTMVAHSAYEHHSQTQVAHHSGHNLYDSRVAHPTTSMAHPAPPRR